MFFYLWGDSHQANRITFSRSQATSSLPSGCWLFCPPTAVSGPAHYCVKKGRVIRQLHAGVLITSSGTALLSHLHTSPLQLMHHAPVHTPFMPSHDTHMFPMNMFTCGMFQTFPVLILSKVFRSMLQASNSKWVNITKKTIKFISLKIKCLVFVEYLIWYRLKMIFKSLYYVFIFVLQLSQLPWNCGL